MKLIGLLLLLSLVSLVEGEVIDPNNPNNLNFGPCLHSFINHNNQPIIPTILPGCHQICQRYVPDPNVVYPNNGYRYATLYSTQNRTPVYSAYHYTGHPQGLIRRENWKIEPQLDNNNGGAAMTTEGRVLWNLLGARQAVKCDYSHIPVQMGHLFPHCHSADQHQSESSFTLTNAAPQTQADNTRWYSQVEHVVQTNIQNRCVGGAGYVVTGVIPSNQWIDTPVIQNRVRIPSHYWSAFCCRDQNQNYISEGYIKVMSGNGQGRVDSYGTAGNPALAQMNADLTGHYGQQFRVFGQQAGIC